MSFQFKTFELKTQQQNIRYSKVAHVRNKMTSVCCYKRQLRTTSSLVNKYKTLKEIELGQSYIATLTKYDVATLKSF